MKPAILLPRRRSRARGVTLIEALVALMVMSFGMVALVTLMGNLRRSADVAKQRSEAMRLAQAEMSTMRSFYALEKPDPTDTTVSDYETNIVTETLSPITLADSNTTFSVQRNVTALTTGAIGKAVQVVVSWQDRASRAGDAAQTLVLESIIARIDPAFSGAVSLPPGPGVIRQPKERHSAIPQEAVDLGNKTSAFRPSGLASTVWVFNNVTGAISQTCSLTVATPLTLSVLTPAACTDTLAYLLSGTINFSNTNPANPSAPEATAVPLDLAIVAGSYIAPRRNSSTGQLVTSGLGTLIMDTVLATPPTHQCFHDAPSSAPSAQPFVNYNCIVYPNAALTGSALRPNWSGSLQMTTLNVGTLASQYRVCRYSADYNANGNAFANAEGDLDNLEHPAVYAQVTGSLPRQNFLIVRGDVACPTAPAVSLSRGVFVDYSTLQLQPTPSP